MINQPTHGPDELQAALDVLHDEEASSEEKAEAASVLGDAGNRDAPVIDALLKALTYGGPPLSEISETAGVIYMVEELSDIRKTAARLRSFWKWRGAVRRTVDSLSNQWVSVVAVDPFNPERRDVETVQGWIALVKAIDNRESARAVAAEIERRLDEEILQEGSYIVRVTAAEALGKLGIHETEALKRALDDEDDGVRASAAEALLRVGNEQDRRLVEEGLKSGRIDEWMIDEDLVRHYLPSRPPRRHF